MGRRRNPGGSRRGSSSLCGDEHFLRPRRNPYRSGQSYSQNDFFENRLNLSSHSPTNSNTGDNGTISIMKHLNDATVRNQVDLVTAACELNEQIKRLDEKLSRKNNEMALRQGTLEILFERQESDLESIKELIKFQLECLNGLFHGMIQLWDGCRNTSVPTTAAEPPPPPPPNSPQRMPSSPQLKTIIQHDIVSAAASPPPEETNVSLATKTVPVACDFCQRHFTTLRNLEIHLQRLPKCCIKKRTRTVLKATY